MGEKFDRTIGECNRCGYIKLPVWRAQQDSELPLWCELCHNTTPVHNDVAATICYVGNAILKRFR